MYKARIAIAIGTVFLLGAASASYAAGEPGKGSATSANATKEPISQGITSVDKNLAKDPGNKGLQTAAQKLDANQQRIEEKRAEKAAKRADKRQDAKHKSAKHKTMHTDKASGHEKMERPEKAARPDKVERPGR